MSQPDRTVFHIATTEEWRAADDPYAPAGFAADGFIHCSDAHQVLRTAERWFDGSDNLVLLAIDCNKLAVAMRYESSGRGAERFPHLHGRLPRDAVVAAEPFCRDASGRFAAPPTLLAALGSPS